MRNRVKEEPASPGTLCQSLMEHKELLVKVMECCPYPIQVFSLDGTARLLNKAALEMIGIRSVESHVGKYNVFEDPVGQKLGVKDLPGKRRNHLGQTIHRSPLAGAF